MEERLEERKQNPVWRGGKELDQKLIEEEGETQKEERMDIWNQQDGEL